MKRYTLICLLVLPIMLSTSQASAGSGSWFSQGSGLVSATGGTQRWQWAATSDAGGANVKGHFAVKNLTTGTAFDATVTCLNVLGSTARLGILITSSTEPTRPAGQTTFITMSTTGTGSDAVNSVGADTNLGTTPLSVCPTPSGYITPFDGTISIRSEATSGGWLSQGAGTVGSTTQRWEWVATSDVGGSNVQGHFSERDTSADTGFDASVTCLNVSGNTARIGIVVTSSTEPTQPVGQSDYITMSASAGGNLVGASPTTTPAVCPAPSGYSTPFDGTIIIRSS